MDDSLARKLSQLGLDKRGVHSPSQKAALAVRAPAPPGKVYRQGPRARILETRVAGTSEIPDYADVVGSLGPTDHLLVRRSEEGELALLDSRGRAVGRVPRDESARLSALVDSGETLYAKVLDIDEHPAWADISIGIYIDTRNARAGGSGL